MNIIMWSCNLLKKPARLLLMLEIGLKLKILNQFFSTQKHLLNSNIIRGIWYCI